MKIKLNGETFITMSIVLLIIYLCLPFSMAFLSSIMIYLLVFLAAGLFLLGMVLLNKWKHLLVFMFIFGVTFLFWLISWRTVLDEVSYVYYCFASLVFVFGGMEIYLRNNMPLIKRLFAFISILFFVNAITSIIGLNIYPLAAREMARGAMYDTRLDFDIYKIIYRRMNIVSWSQAYGMLFAIPTSLIIWKRNKNVFFLSLCVLLSIMMVFAQITFAVLLAVILIVTVFISRETNTKTIILGALSIIIAFAILANLENVLTLAVTVSKEIGLEFLSNKLNDLKVLVLYKNMAGDAEARNIVYSISINTFCKHPILGLAAVRKASAADIGFHSDFLDLTASFGILGLCFIIITLVKYFKFIKKNVIETRREQFIIYVGFIILFVLNPVFNSPQIFAGAFLYPLLADRYCEEKAMVHNIFKIIR